MNIDQDRALAALKQVMDPELHRDLVSLGMVKDLRVEGERRLAPGGAHHARLPAARDHRPRRGERPARRRRLGGDHPLGRPGARRAGRGRGRPHARGEEHRAGRGGQGRGGQEHRGHQPGRRPAADGASGGAPRRRHLRPFAAGDGRHQRPAPLARRQAARAHRGARPQGHVHRLPGGAGPGAHLAGAHGHRGAAPAPARRELGPARLPHPRPAARHRRRAR